MRELEHGHGQAQEKKSVPRELGHPVLHIRGDQHSHIMPRTTWWLGDDVLQHAIAKFFGFRQLLMLARTCKDLHRRLQPGEPAWATCCAASPPSKLHKMLEIAAKHGQAVNVLSVLLTALPPPGLRPGSSAPARQAAANAVGAATRSRTSIAVRMLLEAGASAKTCTKSGTPLLMRAIANLDNATVDVILRADPSVAQICGRPPPVTPATGNSGGIVFYFTGNSEGIALYFTGRALPVTAADARRSLPLQVAAAHNNPGAIALLLAQGARVNAVDASRMTPLLVAITHQPPQRRERKCSAVKALLEGRANVNLAVTMAGQRVSPLNEAIKMKVRLGSGVGSFPFQTSLTASWYSESFCRRGHFRIDGFSHTTRST